jgi:hypothetical protein
MGAWGPAIYSNDTSADVRQDFQDLIGEGMSAEGATSKLMADYGVSAPPDADPDVSADFWLGLALAQHRFGRLLPDVRRAAVAAAGDPRELARWDGPSRRKRQAALENALAKLAEAQPPPRKVKRRILSETNLVPGQHVIFTMESGHRILLRVLSIHEDKGGRGPHVALLEWQDTDGYPADPSRLGVRPDPRPMRTPPEGMGFTLFGNPGDPVEKLEIISPARERRLFGRLTRSAGDEPPRWTSGWVSHWTDLDRFFADDGQVRPPPPRP